MGVLDDSIKNLDEVARKIPFWAMEAVKVNADDILMRYKNFQLSKGIDGAGRELGTYSDSTFEYAEADNITTPKIPGAPYNFYWTGETMENLYLTNFDEKSGTYDIFTVAGKKAMLEREFSNVIFDLTEENNNWINENIVEPYLAQKISENLFDM